jgi:transposase
VSPKDLRACRDADAVTRSIELSDAAWARIEPLMPSSEGLRGRPFRDHRQVVEGVVHRFRTGVPWRDLPERFGPWQTVWKRHHRFCTDGTWDRLLAIVQSDADAAGDLVWEVSVDSSVVRAHQHSAGARHCQKVAQTPDPDTGGRVELHEPALL